MANVASPLADAYAELKERYRQADGDGDWQERVLLGHLVEVADYVARIGDNTHSAHYRADKAGPLLQSAIQLQEQALVGYAGWPEDEAVMRRIEEPLDLLAALATPVVGAAWLAARGAQGGGDATLYRSQVSELLSAVHQMAAWAEKLAATAEPDPID